MNFLGRTLTRIRTLPRMMREPSVSKWKKGLVIFGIIYLFLPIDLIPPVFFPLGFIDDLILWLLILWILKDTLDGYWLGSSDDDLSKKFENENVVKGVDFEVVDETTDPDDENKE